MTELDPFDQPLRHLRRMAPPWADTDRTACGRALNDVASVIPWDEAKALYSKHGRARAAFLFCQTCINRQRVADTPRRWETEPCAVVADYAGHARYGAQHDTVGAELLALADLVAAHPEEYAEHLARRLVPDALAARRRRSR